MLEPTTRYFGIKLYDSDFWELLFRLGLDLMVTFVIIQLIYRPSSRRENDYQFTYYVFAPLIFFVCHLFSKVDLSIGFAFGLFAVFSILRYRTTTIQVKEMTYMFVVIAVAVINALATKKVSYIELFFTNAFVVLLMYLLERFFHTSSALDCIILYEKVENLARDKHDVLIKDLEQRLDREVFKYDILEADYLRDSARLRVYYKA